MTPDDDWHPFDTSKTDAERRIDTALTLAALVLVGVALYGLATWV